jgi:hypothetical protein
MFLTLSVAAQPFVNVLIGRLLDGIYRLTTLVEVAAKDGRLAKFFDDGLAALLAFSSLVINVKDIFKSVFDAITGGNTTVLASLAALAGRLAQFLESVQGQAILQLFADKLQLIGDIISNVLGPLLPLAVKLAQIISGALAAAIQQILPGLSNVITQLVDGFMPILIIIAPYVGQLTEVIADFIVLALRELSKHLDLVIPIFQELARRLGPELGPIVRAFGDLLLAIVPIIPALSTALMAFIPLLITLIPLFVKVAEATVFVFEVLAWLIERIANVIAWFAKLNEAIMKLPIALTIIRDFFVMVWGYIATWFMTVIVPSLSKAFSDISNIVTKTIPDAFRSGVAAIGTAWNRLQDIAKVPVRFFINTVVNDGVIGTFNTVAGFIPGVTKIGRVGLPNGFAAGGEYSGPVSGRPSDSDNVIARGPAGEPIGLATGEFVVRARQAQKHGALLRAINAGMAGYADGGIIGALADPVGWVKDRINGLIGSIPGGGKMGQIIAGAGGRLMSGLAEWVKGKMASLFTGGGGAGPGFLPWPISPGAQRGDSGVWRTIMALVASSGIPYSFGNAYRHGDPLWHGSGRAVDLMGYNQDALASFFMARVRNVLELIHTTNARGYYASRGQVRSSMGAQNELHRNHLHIAMAEGGLLARIFDRGGAWPSGTLGVNTSGRTEQVTSGATMDRVVELLCRLVAAVEQVAPGVGDQMRGVSRGMTQAARAR